MPELSNRQRTFANLMALGNLSPAEAARQAGYAENTALTKSYGWLEKDSIRLAIRQRKDELAAEGHKLNLDAAFIMKRTAELANQNENPAAAVSALRLGADILGLTQGQQGTLPAGLDTFLAAVAQGIQQPRELLVLQESSSASS